jgi:hypothetical protein
LGGRVTREYWAVRTANEIPKTRPNEFSTPRRFVSRLGCKPEREFERTGSCVQQTDVTIGLKWSYANADKKHYVK